jgi:hypothetical protein
LNGVINVYENHITQLTMIDDFGHIADLIGRNGDFGFWAQLNAVIVIGNVGCVGHGFILWMNVCGQ